MDERNHIPDCAVTAFGHMTPSGQIDAPSPGPAKTFCVPGIGLTAIGAVDPGRRLPMPYEEPRARNSW